MRNDKEFKLKNRDESYVKDKRPDIQLGRHTEGEKQNRPLHRQRKTVCIGQGKLKTRLLIPKMFLLKQRLIFLFLKQRIIMLLVPADSTGSNSRQGY